MMKDRYVMADKTLKVLEKVANNIIENVIALNAPKKNISIEFYRKETIKKLKSYPILKQNIEEYKKDLEDIKRENFETVPAVHVVNPNNANVDKFLNDDLAERRLIESVKIRRAILRDITATKEIERALEAIKNEPYNNIIQMQYFKHMNAENIADELKCDIKTVYRNRIKLLDILTLKFFGGDAI